MNPGGPGAIESIDISSLQLRVVVELPTQLLADIDIHGKGITSIPFYVIFTN